MRYHLPSFHFVTFSQNTLVIPQIGITRDV
nr:MAG TPA: hypothetical protein [Bacteriophage sp.]